MELNNHNIKRLLFIIAVSLLMFFALVNISPIFFLFKKIIKVLMPFIIGAAMAFIINILLRPLEASWSYIFRKSKFRIFEILKRPVCLILSILLLLGGLTTLLVYIVPEIIQTLTILFEKVPQYMKYVPEWFDTLSKEINRLPISVPEPEVEKSLLDSGLLGFIAQSSQTLFIKIADVTAAVFSILYNVVLGFIFSIYVLAKKETLGRQMKKLVLAVFPEERTSTILTFISHVNQTFISFVTGQFVEAIVIGLLCFIGMGLFSMPYAPVISVLVGVTALIPIFGAFIGIAIGAFLILIESPITALWFVVFMIILQQFEGNVIYPAVVGKSVGLPGLWVLISVTVGGSLFGIAGMLLSVPICSILYFTACEAVNNRLYDKDILPSEAVVEDTAAPQ